MPKISKRRTLLVEPLARHQVTMILTPQARKISFEDESAMPSSSRLVQRLSSSGSLPRTNHSLSSRKMLMRRPTPSVCLSQLAISCSSSDDSDSDTTTATPTRCPYSPTSAVISNDESCSSLWGQFVDVIPPTSEEDNDLDGASQSSQSRTTGLGSSQHSYQPYKKRHRYNSKRVAIRKYATKGFLPGFVLLIPKPATSTDLMGALQRMHV